MAGFVGEISKIVDSGQDDPGVLVGPCRRPRQTGLAGIPAPPRLQQDPLRQSFPRHDTNISM